MEVIHQKHIDRNLVPFSLNWAKDMMIQLVEVDYCIRSHIRGRIRCPIIRKYAVTFNVIALSMSLLIKRV